MSRGRGPAPKPLEQIHGLRSTYVNRRCRCKACTDANRSYQRAYWDRPKQ